MASCGVRIPGLVGAPAMVSSGASGPNFVDAQRRGECAPLGAGAPTKSGPLAPLDAGAVAPTRPGPRTLLDAFVVVVVVVLQHFTLGRDQPNLGQTKLGTKAI